MKILENIDLKQRTTIRVGGTASLYFVPETIDELMTVINEYSPISIIGGVVTCLSTNGNLTGLLI